MSTPNSPKPRPQSSGDEVCREAKRRKIRKGTTSCWECKKRKTRCEYPEKAGPCLGCQQRGTSCVSQEFDHAAVAATTSKIEVVAPEESVTSRLARVESLLQKVLERVSPDDSSNQSSEKNTIAASEDGTLVGDLDGDSNVDALGQNPHHAPSLLYGAVIDQQSIDSPDAKQATSSRHPSLSPATLPKYHKMRRALYELLPSQHDADVIVAAGSNAAFLQSFTVQNSDLIAGRMRSASSLSSLPGPTSHPILFIRALLQLTLGIQLLPLSFDFKQLQLGDDAKKVMRKYLETASNLIATNGELIGNVEGLECIVLEGMFHVNEANVRRAWLLFRRAINLGQLMGLHRGNSKAVTTLDPHSITDSGFMWSKIVHMDRYLALMLGLPAGHPQRTPSAALNEVMANECMLHRMELIQSETSAQIIERNENMAYEDYSITQGIDAFLNQATQRVPLSFFDIPNLRASCGTASELSDILHIMMQISHYKLLILLHLPYMLRVSRERRYDYSKITCLNASRDLLVRFLSFRSFSFSSFCCRGIDLTAFTASLTLLLAHLDNRQNNYGMYHLLTARRQSDLSLVQQSIILVSGPESIHNPLSEQMTTILKSVLAIEANTSDNDASLRLMIPYFGEITIMREGIIKSPLHSPPAPDKVPSFTPTGPLQTPLCTETANSGHCSTGAGSECSVSACASDVVGPGGSWNHLGQLGWQSTQGVPLTNKASGTFAEMTLPVGLTADVDSWALQGIDSTFFGSLLRGNSGSRPDSDFTFNFPS